MSQNGNSNNKPAQPAASGVSQEDLLKAIKEGIALGVGSQTQQAPQVVYANGKPPAAPNIRCGECRQKQAACKGKHRKIVALPQNRRLAKWFQGYELNGVTYLSANYNHKVTIPADCDAEHTIATWEENETLVLDPNARTTTHNSGSIGRGGKGFNPVDRPGFR